MSSHSIVPHEPNHNVLNSEVGGLAASLPPVRSSYCRARSNGFVQISFRARNVVHATPCETSFVQSKRNRQRRERRQIRMRMKQEAMLEETSYDMEPDST